MELFECPTTYAAAARLEEGSTCQTPLLHSEDPLDWLAIHSGFFFAFNSTSNCNLRITDTTVTSGDPYSRSCR